MIQIPLSFPLCAAALILAGPALVQAVVPDVVMDSIELTETDHLVATFSDDGTGEIEDFGIEYSPDLSADSWGGIEGATFTPEGGGRWGVDAPIDPAWRRAFFRVTKAGVALSASFSVPVLRVSEGDAGAAITVEFNRPFTGTLRYELDGQPASVALTDATSTTVAVPTDGDLDDSEPGQLRTLTLSLELEGAGGGATSYLLGLNSTSTILIEDNDILWSGMMELPDKGGEIGIRILRTDDDGVVTTCFKTDKGGLIPPAPGGSNWLFSHFDLDLETHSFTASVSGVVIPADSTLYGTETQMSIGFAAGGEADVSAERISGDFTLSTSVTGSPHLDISERSGRFTLIRRPGLADESTAPTAP